MKNKIYIGDNLELLKALKLKESVRVIYIDPPYNTGTDKTYNDKSTSEKWDEDFRLRLKLAHKALQNNGVIFISIDDAKFANVKLICDAIFGRVNFLGTFITKQALRSNAKHINTTHEYVLAYAKDKKLTPPFELERLKIPEQRAFIATLIKKIKSEFQKSGQKTAKNLLKNELKKIMQKENITWIRNYNEVDENGEIFFARDLSTPSKPATLFIEELGLKLEPLKTRGWSSSDKILKLHKEDRLHFKAGRPYAKIYLREAKDSVTSVLNFYSRQGTNDLAKLGLAGLFDTPKPVGLIKFLLRIVGLKDGDVVMDFYAGSGTSAQAVYELGFEDGLKLSYILMQKDEAVNEKSSVYKACLRAKIKPFISEILKLRIKTCLEKLKINEEIKIVE